MTLLGHGNPATSHHDQHVSRDRAIAAGLDAIVRDPHNRGARLTR